MSLNSILSKLFGNKSQRDLKEIQPIVDQINALGPRMKELTNDELRDTINRIKQELADATSADTTAIAEIKNKIEELPFDERQPLWDDIDNREKNILETYEKELDRVLPTVFAAMRETAARFAANETIEVTATDMDRDLAAAGKDFVSIEGDKPYTATTGWPAVTKSNGTWYTTMYSSLAVSCCIKAKSPRWQPVKVRHSLQPSPYSSAHSPAEAYTW